MQFVLHITLLCKVSFHVLISLEISLVRAVYGIEREFDRYYLRLK